MAQINIFKRVSMIIAIAILLLALLPQYSSAETIAELQQKSVSLQAKIDNNNAEIIALSKKGDSLENKVSQLNIEISQANSEIRLTEVKLRALRQKLIEAEEELSRQKDLLKAALRALYQRRGASTIELLIASDSFADFISGQEYLERLQTAIKDSTDHVIEIKKQIEVEKTEQEDLLKKQEKQKIVLDDKRSEQQTILDETEGEESRYREIVASQHAELEKAEKQLVALLSAGAASLGPVSRGQKLGEVGNTGYSFGSHTHFQVYKNGSTVNPYVNGSLINGYSWPLFGGAGWISQSYGCVASYWTYIVKCNNGQSSFHSGLDIAANYETPLVAAADGEIIFKGCKGGLGYVVVVDHGGGWQTWYPHQITPDGQRSGYC